MHSYAIAHHQELKERSDRKAILELKEELSKLKSSHAEAIQILKDKLKNIEDKHSSKIKEWEPKEKKLQEDITGLKNKAKE